MSSLSTPQILQNLNISQLNEMQEVSIKQINEEHNIVLRANTGSGKTLAFLLPIALQMSQPEFQTEALIIAPTRELALQIEQVWKQMGTGYKVTCCYGGHKREIEENNLIQAPKLIIGTPGRLCDHLRRGNIDTSHITTLVIDEFDKSLEYGYTDDITFIMEQLNHLEKKIFTSATNAVDLPDFTKMEDAIILDFVKEEQHDWNKIIYQKVISEEAEKAEDLYKLLCQIGNRSTIIFCNHKETVERLHDFLKSKSIHNVFYHGSMEQRDREAALSKFRNGSTNFLITTDLASRGLDIENLRFVIHYQMPHTEDAFIHRNGRTARMNASGTIISIMTKSEAERPYIQNEWEMITFEEDLDIPEKPKWVTLYLPHGKKNKVNKGDILGFLTKVGNMKADDVGMIEVKDFHCFVAVKKSAATYAVNKLKEERIKGKKSKLEVQK